MTESAQEAQLNVKVSKDKFKTMPEQEYRGYLYDFLVDITTKVDSLSWQKWLNGIPWLIVGGLVGFILTCWKL